MVKVARAPRDSELLLPGSISAIAEASIYARAAGYVRKRLVDIGDRVRTGQLLAEIETPDFDQQVAQTRAALAQARQQLSQTQAALVESQAQRDLAKVTWQRYDNLVKRGAVARQDADQQESGYKTAEALVTAQQANVNAAQENVSQAQANLDRMVTLQEYQNVRAPFDGVVTARNIDTGYLISSTGGGQGSAPINVPGAPAASASGNEMFRVAQIGTLRIVIDVPQANTADITVGMPAEVLVQQLPGRVFHGKVTRTANSLDPNSRTMPTQIELPNEGGKLFPGMYAQVRFRNHRDAPPLLVAGDAIIAGAAGTQVAVLEDVPTAIAGDPQKQGAKRIHLQTVQLGRDYGPQTEIASGLEGWEWVVVNPGDEVREGNLVKPEARDATPGPSGSCSRGGGPEMSARFTAQAVAVSLCCLLALPGAGQTPPGRMPQITYSAGPLGAYKPGSVSLPDFRDSKRIDELVRAGQLYLSLQDAIALALENNLDLELERYGLRMAATDTYRAQGGGVLRGVPLSVAETPAGIGGPGSPLLTSAATGVLSQTTVPVNVTDTQLIAEGQDNLAYTGTFPFASGPLIPLFDPVLTGQLLGEHSNTPQTSLANSNTTSFTDNSFAGNAAWTQGFSTGTQIAAGFQSQYNNLNSVKNLFNPFDTSTLGITVTQPLLRGFGIELNRRFIRIAKNSEKISDYVFQQQIISTISGVIRLYYDLVALDEDLKVKQETLATAQRLYEDNMNKVDQGTLAPIEATRAEAQVAAARQDQINSEGLVRQQELILKNVLSRSWGDDPMVHDARIVLTDTVTLEPLPTQTPAEIVTQAIPNRPEYQAAKLQLTNTEISLKGTKSELRPELDLVGNLQNNGLAGAGNPALVPFPAGAYNGLGGGYGTDLAQLFKFDYPTYSVGLNLTLPIHNRIAQADVARDELQVRQTEVRLKQLENQIRVEIEDALIALARTRSAYEAAVETRKLQEQSLQIEQEKFDVGLSTNFLVIQYQSYVAQARSTEVASLDAYAKAKVQYERAIGLTLPNHNVSIDEALRGQSSRTVTALPPLAPPRQ